MATPALTVHHDLVQRILRERDGKSRREAVVEAGMTPYEVLRTGTVNVARFFGIDISPIVGGMQGPHHHLRDRGEQGVPEPGRDPMIATIRPDAWNFPLFLHVAGALKHHLQGHRHLIGGKLDGNTVTTGYFLDAYIAEYSGGLGVTSGWFDIALSITRAPMRGGARPPSCCGGSGRGRSHSRAPTARWASAGSSCPAGRSSGSPSRALC